MYISIANSAEMSSASAMAALIASSCSVKSVDASRTMWSSGAGVWLLDFDGGIPVVWIGCGLCRNHTRKASSCRYPCYPHPRKSGVFDGGSPLLSYFRVEGDRKYYDSFR